MNVTVIMAVHNAMPYLPEALRSILSQSYDHFTLIVVNDGSTDGSAEYLNRTQDTRLRVLSFPVCRGQGAARNAAAELCETEYIAFMDADDISLRDRLRKQVEYLAAN